MFPRAVYGGIRCSDIETIDQMAKWLNGGGDINSREVSIFWETPLILQAIKGNTDVVKYLINKGANFNIADDYNATPFERICQYGHEDLFDYFVETLHVNIDGTTHSPIGRACNCGQINIVKKLLNLGAKIDGQDYHAIHSACYGGGNSNNPVELVNHLILHGADLNVQTKKGKTPLHLAVAAENLNIIEKLLVMNVDTTIVNNEGQTAFENIYSKSLNRNKIEELFKKYSTHE